MSIDLNTFHQQKLTWLANQVNVDFPTPESVKGRDVYLNQETLDSEEYTYLSPVFPENMSILLVTEHRLTIRWAMTVASQWDTEYDDVLEFLTQVDLCDDYQLFIALDGMKPVAACVSQASDDVMYVSDVVVTSDVLTINSFLSAVMEQQTALTGHTFTSCIRT
ncbi:hypothetical protein [Aliivibrio sifiae]|uniref:hypothetical protein n=1 Tax=Aliivibrio sifiae TaxID=566293 RepID=UPI000CF4995A|nr:hypothetical protein [Aliivibrio sifiae]